MAQNTKKVVIGKRRCGFAAMDPALQKQIAAKGGKRARALGTAHEWTSAEAAEAGRKGGSTPRRRKAARHEAPPSASVVPNAEPQS